MFSTQEIQEFSKLLKSGHHVRILSHRNPDADALGSILAFSKICQHYKISYELMSVDEIPPNLQFLDQNKDIQIIQPEQLDPITNEQTDIIAFLDCGQINRAGNFFDYILPHQHIINIDHHMSNPLFGDFNKVVDISSTCELLFHLIKDLDIPIDLELATYLYVGIVTDTGNFQFDKTTAKTHIIVSELLTKGIDHFNLFQKIYQQNPIEWLSFLQNALNHMELFENKSIAFISLEKKDLEGFDDTHVLFPIVMSTNEIKICIILKEKEDGTISASLRSKTDVNVAEIAKVFYGGGHIRAAGCRTSSYSLKEFKDIIYKEIKKHL